MTLHEFEQELRREVHDEVRIIPHPTNEDMAGVYLNGMFVCGCPSKNIYDEKKQTYTDNFGTPHATKSEVYAKLARFYIRVQKEDGFVDLMKEKIDESSGDTD